MWKHTVFISLAVLSIIGAILALMMICLVIIKKKRKADNLTSLIGLLFVFVITILNALFINLTGSTSNVLQSLANSISLLIGPLLYFYVRGKSIQIKIHWPHFLIFFIYTPAIIFPQANIDNVQLANFLMKYALPIVWNLQMAWYLSISFRLSRKILRKNFRWIKWFVLIVSVIWFINLPVFFYSRFIGPLPNELLLMIACLFSLSVIWISFKTLEFPSLYPHSEQYTDSELKNCFNQVHKYLEITKAYRNEHLTLPQLSRELKLSSRLISKSINCLGNEQFKEFINRYRVKEVIKRLHDNENLQFTIGGLAGMAGFKSTSAFYSAFKKETGKTPSEFIS